ncbi:ArgE/DapE family deacylase [Geomicrobium sp. JCM 19038]|uniref:ArgE/DapE family deacylase n=1 Tax=Geomicrobium sp. JCM 19038 TaxID=1460635 RepID=UPI00045F1817|nr:ArgE/DapE family deacylase [Geomicrobium sp. JCM 19038]GAK07705.1 acetylornithine deacetylase [Geomicrobium sp. JCM 19038]
MTNQSIERLNQAIEELWDEQLLFLKSLTSFKSTLGNEAQVQHFIRHQLDDMKLETNAFDPDPERLRKYENYGSPEWDYTNRPVVVGEWKNDGKKTGKSLILQGHIDVVSAEPEHLWTHAPYQPAIVENRLYGRGAVDMKGGVSAMVYALKAIQKSGIQLGADVQIQTVIEEECTGNGALALLDAGYVADGALIPEPTNLQAMKTQLGVMWVRVNVRGQGAHVERAERAQNAINKASKLIAALDDYREHINQRPKHKHFENHAHPLNVNVGVIHGGDWASSVPTECYFEARIGFYPDQKPEEIQAEVKQWILDAAAKDEWLKEQPPTVSFFGFSAPGREEEGDTELYDVLEKAHTATTGTELQRLAFTATTDVRAFEEFGIPSTCYGPTGENMHGVDEYIDLDSLKTATKTIGAFILDWCQEN